MFVLTVKRGKGLEDLFLPLWKGRSNVNLMVSKRIRMSYFTVFLILRLALKMKVRNEFIKNK